MQVEKIFGINFETQEADFININIILITETRQLRTQLFPQIFHENDIIPSNNCKSNSKILCELENTHAFSCNSVLKMAGPNVKDAHMQNII
jgi:hypothetical protein